MEPTWTSPPRSGPSLQPQSHSVHHFTGFTSSSSSSAAVRDILESGRGNGSGGRLACGVAVRGGGERGLGRSSGAGAPTTFAESRFPEWETTGGDDKSGAADVGVWSSTTAEAASISRVGCALTKREEEEPGRGSEKGSSAGRTYGPSPVTGWFSEGPGLGEGDGAAEGEGLAKMSSSRTLSSEV